MVDEQLVIAEVLGAMRAIVARDGGVLELAGYQSGGGVVRVRYTVGHNDECATCTISPAMMREFLLEGLRSHDLAVDDVQITDT